MNHSESLGALNEAFTAAQQDMPQVKKGNTATIPTKSGKEYNYKYADLADVLTAAIPVITKHGLSIRQGFVGGRLQTELHHKSGEWVADDGIILPTNVSPQELGAAITYFRRYGALSMLGIAPEEDDDAASVPHAKANSAQPGTNGHANGNAPRVKVINSQQAAAFRDAALATGYSPEGIKKALEDAGIKSSALIPEADYKRWMEWAHSESEVPA